LEFRAKGQIDDGWFATYSVACLDCGHLTGCLSEEDRHELEKKIQDA
jgi:hypothetical protein